MNGALENLLVYAKRHLELDPRDEVYVRNRLLEALGEEDYEEGKTPAATADNPEEAVGPLVDFALKKGLIQEEEREYFAFKLLDMVALYPSEIIDRFQEKYAKSPLSAFEWLHNYNVKSDYVRAGKIAKNIKWIYEGSKGNLEITVNLSKPEILHTEVKKAAQKRGGYPKCAICAENIGYAGKGTYRQNLRAVPLTLGGEEYFWQFSPYAYFHHHGIAVSLEHKPMRVDLKTAGKLFDFVDYIPDYFIGSNAGLPRVGGSILAHDHFQGGLHRMPLFETGTRRRLLADGFKNTDITVPEWYNSVIRLRGRDRAEIEEIARKIISAWEAYDDLENDIIARTDEQHNGFSVIARKEGGTYILDVVLRNNRTSGEYPDGIFHAHPEYHHIKSEGIGLIEASGLFVLPPRLKGQLGYVQAVLAGEIQEPKFEGDLEPFRDMASSLGKNGKMTPEAAEEAVRKEVGRICEKILENIAVFKDTEKGRLGFRRFLESIGLKEVE